MTARERIMALKYYDRQNRDPDFAKKLGVEVTLDAADKRSKIKKGGKSKNAKNS